MIRVYDKTQQKDMPLTLKWYKVYMYSLLPVSVLWNLLSGLACWYNLFNTDDGLFVYSCGVFSISIIGIVLSCITFAGMYYFKSWGYFLVIISVLYIPLYFIIYFFLSRGFEMGLLYVIIITLFLLPFIVPNLSYFRRRKNLFIISSKVENTDYLRDYSIPTTYDNVNDSKVSAPVVLPLKPPKQVFCKRCGALIDADTKKCTGCGKQYFRWPPATRL